MSVYTVLMSMAKRSKVTRACLLYFWNKVSAIQQEVRYAHYTPGKPDGLLINIGAGNFKHKYWTNLDYVSEWYKEAHKGVDFIPYDIRSDKIPFGDETVLCAYCSHVIEHIEGEYVDYMFREVYRVLKPGGIFRLTFPDADFLYHIASRSYEDYWRWIPDYGEDATSLDYLASETATRSVHDKTSTNPIDPETLKAKFSACSQREFLDYLTEGQTFSPDYPGNHINWWDFEKCGALLSKAGFQDVFRSKHGGSITPYMQGGIFDMTHPVMSCYVEAVK